MVKTDEGAKKYITSGPSKSNSLKQEIVEDYFSLNWGLQNSNGNYYLLGPSGRRYSVFPSPFVPVFSGISSVFDPLYSEFDVETFNSFNSSESEEANVLSRILRSLPEISRKCLVNQFSEFKKKFGD